MHIKRVNKLYLIVDGMDELEAFVDFEDAQAYIDKHMPRAKRGLKGARPAGIRKYIPDTYQIYIDLEKDFEYYRGRFYSKR